MKKNKPGVVPKIAKISSDHEQKGAEPEPGDAISGTFRVIKPKKCCREFVTHLQKRLSASEHEAKKSKQAYRGLRGEFKRLRQDASELRERNEFMKSLMHAKLTEVPVLNMQAQWPKK